MATVTHSEVSPATLLTSAAVARLDDMGWVRVGGEDRVRWLNGMVTNSIQALAPGHGCYNFLLNAQGRIQGDVTAFLTPGAILLQTQRNRLPGLIALLERFIIMDDVELSDISDMHHGLLVAGPNAASVLASHGIPTDALAPLQFQTTAWQDERVYVLHAYSPLVPRFEIWSDSVTANALAASLIAGCACKASAATLEQLRILEGTPRFGCDIRDKELPQETSQTRALHFAKGCYLGQEIVERIRSRGNVHRAFSGFVLAGELPAAGTALHAEDKAVGEITSVARIELPSGPVQLALGYIRREVLERALPITYPGGSAHPTSLPYRPH
jgi:aminomethyltransferase